MKTYNEMTMYKNFIELLQNRRYEQYVLNFMRKSKTIFRGEYEMVKEQSRGECDFIEKTTGEKYDAKLPFTSEQIKLLTNGKTHPPEFKRWIEELQKEAAEFNLKGILNNRDDIEQMKLYKIIEKAVLRDKPDENIIFFMPYPIVSHYEGSIFLQFATDLLDVIYNKLKMKLNQRKIFLFIHILRKINSY